MSRKGCPDPIRSAAMTASAMASVENHLIEVLSAADRRRLLAVCEPVDLRLGEVLHEQGRPTRHAYFPIEGFVSLVAVVDHHPAIEIGMVGREGMLGAQLALGVGRAPMRAIVQGSGSARRIGAAALRREIACSVGLQRVVARYLHVMMTQLGTAGACLHFHQIGPRLARWLLMSQDRAHGESFRITHEFLAYMLGVRRVGVTVAAGLLQAKGLIAYRRGVITVCDRAGLEAAACSCYATDRLSYAALIR